MPFTNNVEAMIEKVAGISKTGSYPKSYCGINKW